jgi:ABC-2 type transport system permease protein/sodium transport system permease protein
MSAAPSSVAAAANAPAFSVARILRLARKELRETLRDRRTILTLLVMPLLVYPVLSLAFKQFLLASFQQSSELRLHFASSTQTESLLFMKLLAQGDRLIQEFQSAAATTPVSGGPILGAELGSKEPRFQDIEMFVNPEDRNGTLEELVHRNDIDLAVRLLPADGADTARGESRFQLIFRPNQPISRQAASFVERRLKAVNEYDLQERLAASGDTKPLRTSWRLKPIADEEGHSFWLGTLVPLVLILMTITGAVYPAIDLTAGERERGTLESLMAAPVPRLSVLMAKYIAVVTVAMLTAVINLTAMTVTIASAGLGPVLFGDKGLAPQSILAVLILLALFAAFFSAVLLLITSFARSFKEAQAYLIPLMVASLAPGYMSVMPGLELGPVMSVTPLANMVLLARDVLEGDAPLLWGSVAVLSTILYGALALALAARVFGSDAILYGSEGSWSDLFRQPRQPRSQATLSGALAALAIVAPSFVILSGMLAQMQMVSMGAQLLAAACMTLLLFIVLPLALARLQGVDLRSGFQLHQVSPLALLAAIALGCTLWPLAYDSIIFCQRIGIATFSAEALAEHRPVLEALVERMRSQQPALVLFALAIAPAIGEELFFRGYLLGALRGRLPAWGAIAVTGVIFGLFHANVMGVIAIERIASSTLLGLVLGWICWRTGSVIPGMTFHALHNGLMVSLVFWGTQLQAWGWDSKDQHFLPLPLVAVTSAVAAIALAAVARISRRPASAPPEPVSDGQAVGTTSG